MNTQFSKSVRRAFTLIEMIGVLAVIGILAALLVPKIFESINNARINGAAVSIASVKTGVADHFAKFGSLVSSNGVAIAAPVTNNYDLTFVTEGFMDKRFASKLATEDNTFVRLMTALPSSTAVDADNAAYALGSATTVNTATGSYIVEVAMNDVLEADAKALNDIIDGTQLGVALGASTGDLYGRVKYSPIGTGTTVDMKIYVTHR
jgi:prepilin-type N-terminal cleavage/methylation domain-containing protein